MKHNWKKIIASVLVLMMVFTPSTVGMMNIVGAADTGTASADGATYGNKPIAAYDFTDGKLSDTSDRHLPDVVLANDGISSYNATATSNGIHLEDGWFALTDQLFAGVSDVDGLTISMEVEMLTSSVGNEWGETFFNVSPVNQGHNTGNASEKSIHMDYNGNVGTGAHPYSGDGSWLDGKLANVWGPVQQNETHTVTLTYDPATDSMIIYADGGMVDNSNIARTWGKNPTVFLTAEDISKLTYATIGSHCDGGWGMYLFADIKTITVYSTALSSAEVLTLYKEGKDDIQNGIKAVENHVKPEPAMKGEGDGSFTVAAVNVDGLPETIEININLLITRIQKTIELNVGGPGAAGETAIGTWLSQKGYDIIGTSENFQYRDELANPLKSNGYIESHRNNEILPSSTITSVSTLNSILSNLPINTDGLTLFWKDTVAMTQHKTTKDGDYGTDEWNKETWEQHWSPNSNYSGYEVPDQNGADGLIDKGFRYFTATIDGTVPVDVYIFHMDADTSEGDINAREAQMQQLVDYIKLTDTSNPIIIMGDTNNRYTRDKMEEILIGGINAIDGLEAKDAWVETFYDGVYPAYGTHAIMADQCGYEYGEIVDKIVYINNDKSDYYLNLSNFYVDTDYTNDNGDPLGDHFPVVAEFTYAMKHTVTFVDENDEVIGTLTKLTGETLTKDDYPAVPEKEGYRVEWPTVTSPITEDITIKAIYLPLGNIDGDASVTTPDNEEGEEVFVVINRIEDEELVGEIIADLIEQLGELADELDPEKVIVVDICLYNNKGLQIEKTDDGMLLITVYLPEDIDASNGVVLYRLEEDGSFTKIESKVEDGKLIFETEHLSTYVIAEKASTEVPGDDAPGTTDPGTDDPGTDDPGTTDPDGDPAAPPITGDDSSVGLWMIMAIISVFGVVTCIPERHTAQRKNR